MKKPDLAAIRATFSEAVRMAFAVPVRTDEEVTRSRSLTKRVARALLIAVCAYAACCLLLVVGLSVVFGTVQV